MERCVSIVGVGGDMMAASQQVQDIVTRAPGALAEHLALVGPHCEV